jgi:EAL domain-containing protein (putative c-di-GMP-specific phosphodiesterase class I)
MGIPETDSIASSRLPVTGETSADRPRVLTVDDDADALLFFTACLEGAGMDAATADSGEQALEMIAEGGFDTVVTDVQMPGGMSGTELLLRVRERDPDLPVVLVTGAPEGDLPAGTMELAPGGLLLKPVDVERLVRAVYRAVRFCRLARVARRQEVLETRPSPAPPVGPTPVPALERALGSLYLAWQPIVSSADGTVRGQEAFVRTLEPSLSAPVSFFSAAREQGRVVDLGRAVRRVAAREAASFPGQLAWVNVDVAELFDDALVDAASPLAPIARSVVLELSQQTVLGAPDGVVARLRELRRLGFRIAVDDFGSMNVDLAGLARVEPDVVKLDLPLIRGLDSDPALQAQLRWLVKALHVEGIEIVAEGVETPGERYAAVDFGVDFLQGFLFGRPKPLAAS